MTILTTKKLTDSQRTLVVDSRISLVEYDAIKIDFLPVDIPEKVENAIFTSQNAVLSIQDQKPTIQHCFCVGEKTKLLLEKNGYKVIKMAEYASELSDYLSKNHKNDFFHFFCGNIRSEEIPSALKKNQVAFEEIIVYNTTLTPKKFEREFDAILFFSPSGVRSHFGSNSPKNSKTIAVCIGTTTASEAKKYSDNVVISKSTTVESVIAKTVKTLQSQP